MSIVQITYLSYCFYMLSAFFAVLAVILFVAFDICRIWNILRGKKTSASKKRIAGQAAIFDFAAPCGSTLITQKISHQGLHRQEAEETVPLQEATVPLENSGLSLIQDITYINDSVSVI